MTEGPTVCLTVDVEPDCPPYLWTWRGIEEGMPRLLELLDLEGVPATMFTTSQVAERYPDIALQIVSTGHELACHGVSHTAFTSMDRNAAEAEITASASLLRCYAPVVSFRAPYLRFPVSYLDLLERSGFRLDSSQAKYKRSPKRPTPPNGLLRVPASVTSSVLRLPRLVREAYIGALASPVVLFVHPWELVDLRYTRLRWDCRFRTGRTATDCLRSVIRFFRARGACFVRMDALLGEAGEGGSVIPASRHSAA